MDFSQKPMKKYDYNIKNHAMGVILDWAHLSVRKQYSLPSLNQEKQKKKKVMVHGKKLQFMEKSY